MVSLALDTRWRRCTWMVLLHCGLFPLSPVIKLSPGDSRSPQSSTSISPSVSSARLAALQGADFPVGWTSPFWNSCGGLEMAAGPLPGAWLSVGRGGGASGAEVTLGATTDSWVSEWALQRKVGGLGWSDFQFNRYYETIPAWIRWLTSPRHSESLVSLFLLL